MLRIKSASPHTQRDLSILCACRRRCIEFKRWEACPDLSKATKKATNSKGLAATSGCLKEFFYFLHCQGGSDLSTDVTTLLYGHGLVISETCRLTSGDLLEIKILVGGFGLVCHTCVGAKHGRTCRHWLSAANFPPQSSECSGKGSESGKNACSSGLHGATWWIC